MKDHKEKAKNKKKAKNRQPQAVWEKQFKSPQKAHHTQDINSTKTAHRKKVNQEN